MAYDPDYGRKVRSENAVLAEKYEDRGQNQSDEQTHTRQREGIDIFLNTSKKVPISQENFEELMGTIARIILEEGSDRLATMFFDCKQMFDKSLNHIDGMEDVEKKLWTLATGEIIEKATKQKQNRI